MLSIWILGCFFPHLAQPLSLTAFSFGFCPLQIDENVQREIINHRSLRHPNIVRFKEVCARLLLDYVLRVQRHLNDFLFLLYDVRLF